MTAITERIPVEQLVTDARQVQPSHVLLVLFLGFFWAIGWTAGHLWLGAVLCAVSVRRGWRDGTGYVPQQLPGRP
jgi:hypothetical protein